MHPEIRNFTHYVDSLYRHSGAVAGSFILTVALWSLARWGPWGETLPPWVSPVLIGGGFVISNYLAWRENWLKLGLERPSLPKGIDLIQTISHQGSHDSERLKFTLTSKVDLRGKAVRISCNGPIYSKSFYVERIVGRKKYRMKTGSQLYTNMKGNRVIFRAGEVYELTKREFDRVSDRVELLKEPAQDGIDYENASLESIRDEDTNTIIFDFGGKWLETDQFKIVNGEIGSVVPLKITKVEWLETKPS